MFEVEPRILEISKALGEDTRFAIFKEISGSEHSLTVKDLVARFGMHHSAIRIHLNKLEEAGLIYSRKLHTPGAVGRPQLAFEPTNEALSISLPTRNYRLLSDIAMQFISEDGDLESAPDFGFRWGSEHIRGNGHVADGSRPFEESVRVLVEKLNGWGANFAITETNGSACTLQQHNCPFLEIAQKHRPLVCSMLQGAARGMLTELSGREVDWLHRSSLVEGDPICEAEVRVRNGSAA